MMLGRHAEDLYWAGRYLERVQDTARILDVTHQWAISSPVTGSANHWNDVAAVLMLPEVADLDPSSVMRVAITDADNPNAIYSLLDQARENVRRVRELLSSELWEAVNDVWLSMHDGQDVNYDIEHHPSLVLGGVKTRCQTIVGVAAETMPRDDALCFLRLGSHLERAAFACRVVNVYARPLLDQSRSLGEWLHVLRICAGAEAYLRRGGAGLPEADVVRFLMLDESFPRSATHAVKECFDLVSTLDPSGRSRPSLLLGRLVAELQYAELDEWLGDDFGAVLDAVHAAIIESSDAVAARFFGRTELDPFQIQAVSAGGSASR